MLIAENVSLGHVPERIHQDDCIAVPMPGTKFFRFSAPFDCLHFDHDGNSFAVLADGSMIAAEQWDFMVDGAVAEITAIKELYSKGDLTEDERRAGEKFALDYELYHLGSKRACQRLELIDGGNGAGGGIEAYLELRRRHEAVRAFLHSEPFKSLCYWQVAVWLLVDGTSCSEIGRRLTGTTRNTAASAGKSHAKALLSNLAEFYRRRRK